MIDALWIHRICGTLDGFVFFLLLSFVFDSVTGNWVIIIKRWFKSDTESRYEMRLFVSSPNIFVVFGDVFFFVVVLLLSFHFLSSSLWFRFVCVHFVHIIIYWDISQFAKLTQQRPSISVERVYQQQQQQTIQQFTNSFYWFLLLSCIICHSVSHSFCCWFSFLAFHWFIFIHRVFSISLTEHKFYDALCGRCVYRLFDNFND